MANVNMDLAELKQLEEKIKKLELEKQNLLDKQQQVLITHKHYDGKIVYSDGAKAKNLHINGFYFNNKYDLRNRPSFFNGGCTPDGYNMFDQHVSFDELVANDIFKVDLTENTNKTSKEYKNLNEVITEIRNEEKSKLINQIESSNNRAIQAEVANETMLNDHKKELIRIEKKYSDKLEKEVEKSNKDIEKINDKHSNDVEKLKNKISELEEDLTNLKENKKQLSLEEQISNMTKELKENQNLIKKYKEQIEDSKNKSLFKRILNQ